MEMCYNDALVMPSNYVVMDNEEMEYVEGGGAYDIAMSLLMGIVGGVIANKFTPYLTMANFTAALSAAGAAAGAAAGVVYTAVANAVAWVWNTPVALACLGVAVGVAGTIFTQYIAKKYF